MMTILLIFIILFADAVYETPKPKKTIKEIFRWLLLKIIIMLIWVGFYGGFIAFLLLFFFFNKMLISFICLIPPAIFVGWGMIIQAKQNTLKKNNTNH